MKSPVQGDFEISNLLEQLSSLAKGINSVGSHVEADFLKLGDALQAIYSGASGLTQRTQEAVKDISGEADSNLLIKIGNFAKSALKGVDQHQNKLAKDLKRVAEISDHLKSLDSICPEIDRIGRFLNVVGVNMGVECVRSDRAEKMFDDVYREIKVVAANIRDVIENIREDANTSRNIQIREYNKSIESLTFLKELTDEARMNIQDAVKRVDKLMEFSASTISHAGKESQMISDQVGEIVMNIQFQDNMRQRAEHIFHTLSGVKKLLKEQDSENKSCKSQETGLGRAHQIIQLQAAQLKEIVSEVTTLHTQSLQSFSKIQKGVESLEHIFSEVGIVREKPEKPIGQITEQESEGEDNSLAALDKALKSLQDIFGKGSHLVKKMSDTMEHAFDAAKALAEYADQVSDISDTTHILAVNAIIMSSKLGKEGWTLSVLAREVSELSGQASELTSSVQECLGKITESVDHQEPDDQKAKKEGQPEDSVFRYLSTIREDVSKAYELIQKNAREAAGESKALKTMIANASAGLEFFTGLNDTLSGYMRQLEEIVQTLEPWKTNEKVLSSDEIEGFLSEYTMEKERMILNQTIEEGFEGENSNSNTAALPAFGNCEPGEDDGKGQSVELFDPVLDNSAGEDEEKETSDKNSIVFSGNESIAEEDLGDNVELF